MITEYQKRNQQCLFADSKVSLIVDLHNKLVSNFRIPNFKHNVYLLFVYCFDY